MTLASYDELQDTDVKWLGDAPAHWKVGRFRHHFQESPEKIDKEVVGVMLSVSGYRGIEIKEYDDENRRRLDEELVGYRIVRVGQLVVNSMWLNAAGLGVSAFEGHVSPAYRSYWIGEGLNLRYVHHLMRSAIYVDAYTSMAQGIRPNSLQLSRTDLMNLPVLIPPLPEQTAIASFLDTETSKIDSLVSEQRRLIELLKEKRQAVISHAVTKGLNPDVPMKESGIEWLGEVPEGWEMKRLKHISPAVTVGIVVNPSTFATDHGLPFIHGGDIREGIINTKDARKISSEASEQNAKTKLDERDVLTVRVGAGRGTTAVVPPECNGGNCASVMLVRKGEFNSDWLCFAMNDRLIQFQIKIVEYGAAQPQFNISHAIEFWFPVPERDEQDEIARYLLENTALFNQLLTQAERAIELLQERRTALISAAVTGKIDVREFATEAVA